MSEDKSLRRPIIDPLILALKSRRVLVALCALVIGGYSLEDAAHAGRDASAVPPEDLRDLIKDALNDFVDEIGKSPSNPDQSA